MTDAERIETIARQIDNYRTILALGGYNPAPLPCNADDIAFLIEQIRARDNQIERLEIELRELRHDAKDCLSF